MSFQGELEVGEPKPAFGEGSASDRVLAHIRSGIANCRFAPGQRLIEADLTAALGVSRGPVREAFRRLAAEGLIEIVPHRGALVRRLTFEETIELFQIRTELEALAARLAAERIADGGVRCDFEGAIRPIWNGEPRLSATAYLDENRRFHEAVFAAGGNGQLAEVAVRLQLPLLLFQSSGVLTPESLCASVTEHQAIARAILAGDAEAADTAIRAHLARATALTRNMPRDIFRASAGRVAGR
jgi:DNA-binding GntR family transcriptional regulator